MTNLGQILKQAQQFQTVLQKLQDDLKQIKIVGDSAGGMCEVTLNGKGEACDIKIDPSLLLPDDSHVLEDLLVTAFNNARSKVEEEKRQKLDKITGGIPLPPGIQLPF